MIQEQNGELSIVKKGEEVAPSEPKVEEIVETKTKVEEEIVIVSAVDEEEAKKDSDDIIVPDEDGDYESLEMEEDYLPEENKEIVEELVIVASSDVAVVEEKKPVVDTVQAINNAIKDAGLEDVLSKNEEDVINQFINKTKVVKPVSREEAERVVVTKKDVKPEGIVTESTAIEAVSLLEKFKNYITSSKFDKQCETAAKKHGIKKNIVKNKVVAGFLNTVANVLGLTVTLAGDVIMSAINFIGFIINKIVEFTVDNLKKLITLLTLNCGEII